MPASTTGPHDLVVQLTGSPEDAARMAFAERIASDFAAHLIGIHLHILPEILEITDPAQSGVIRSLLEASDRDADRSFSQVSETFANLAVSSELRRLHGLPSLLGSDLADIARSADLFIGTRPYGDPAASSQIEERVLFGSGRACLFLPPGGRPHAGLETIAVAWDGSREAARAVAEAMPFLARAGQVHLVAVAPATQDIDGRKHFAGILAHLTRCGVGAQTTVLPYVTTTGEQLEQFAHQKGADLIVMGAYGHARMVEWVFGGATRHLLRNSTLPLLMAH